MSDYVNIIADFDKQAFPNASKLWKACLSGDYSLIITGGAVRGGKSFGAIGSLIGLHYLYPGSRSMIVRDTLETLRKNTYPTCEKAIPDTFVKKFKGDPQFEWTFKNGAKMFFFSENYHQDKLYNRWNGLEINFILLEQIEELQLKALEKSFERVGSYVIQGGNNPKPLIIATVNPTHGWVKEHIYDRYKNGTLPEGWLYLPALLTDNPYIPQTYKDSLLQLKAINPVKYAQFVEGDWDIQEHKEGAFWKSFDYNKHVGDYEIDLSQTLHISFDENVRPYPALTIWQIDSDKKTITQIHEICLRSPRNKLIEVASEFCSWAKAKEFNNVIYLYGDASSDREDAKLQKGMNYFSMFRDKIRERGFNIQIRKSSKNPPVAISAEFINAIYAYNFRDWVIGIDRRCKESLNDYVNAEENTDGTMKKTKEGGIEIIGHCSDTKRYFLSKALKDDFKYYQKGSNDLIYELGLTDNYDY